MDKINELNKLLKGVVSASNIDLTEFSTDASAYRERPLGIVTPKKLSDLDIIVDFANKNNIPLIPRGAGTSLAGQVVGKGLVINFAQYLNNIIEVNKQEKWVWVQPGVVLNQLNTYLEDYELFFGPETSTASRCTIGGMLGNNSCGLHSLIYGSVREHILEVEAILSDGSTAIFKPLTNTEYNQKLQQKNLEGEIYRGINNILSQEHNRKAIIDNYPNQEITRRNTGYALDSLALMSPFTKNGEPFNIAKLIAGSEGTLVVVKKIKLALVDLPPKHKLLVCSHFKSLDDAIQGNLTALENKPRAIELMDGKILELASKSKSQENNSFFIVGKPQAILIIELGDNDYNTLTKKKNELINNLKSNSKGYEHVVVNQDNMSKVWELRRSGLGVLSNMKGDNKSVSVIEDTAVRPQDLSDFIFDMKNMLKSYNKESVYHAHIATGEIHVRPVLNLKDSEDVVLFRKIAYDAALLVKKYNGSLSGEHGDGRLRGEFIPLILGDFCYNLILEIKKIFDYRNIFNPNKITDTPSMNTSLRYKKTNKYAEFKKYFSWEKTDGMVRAAEKCSGSGDCIRPSLLSGTMCPSYMATKSENYSTRARANMLREYFTGEISSKDLSINDVKEVLSYCLSCKACKSECPAGVDITKLKAEFTQYYYNKKHYVPLSALFIANSPNINKILSVFPGIYNFFATTKGLHQMVSFFMGFHPKRSIPKLSKLTLNKWIKKHNFKKGKLSTVYLFSDEFTNYLESDLGIKTVLFLEKLGYNVIVPKIKCSGRTYLSKGLVKQAKKIINYNIKTLSSLITEESPFIGIEPSAILTFRDEYVDLATKNNKQHANNIKNNSFTIEEFIWREIQKNNIRQNQFTSEKQKIKFHGHCYQKALSNTNYTKNVLSFPVNYEAEEIKSGCCGMAGAYGFQKATYKLSNKIAEMVLLPEVRNTNKDTFIAAAGTSCRHQIIDGTGRVAYHPIEILYDALKK